MTHIFFKQRLTSTYLSSVYLNWGGKKRLTQVMYFCKHSDTLKVDIILNIWTQLDILCKESSLLVINTIIILL